MSCTTTPVLYTLSLHDALPISREVMRLLEHDGLVDVRHGSGAYVREPTDWPPDDPRDRKSTRLNSSHANISYAVFCLKKKKKTEAQLEAQPKNGPPASEHRHDD